MFEKLTQFAVGRRWWIIAAWILAAIVIVPFSPKLGDVTNSDESSFLPSSYESAQADKLAAEAFPGDAGATALLVFKRADGATLTTADRAAIANSARAVAASGIVRVDGIQTGAREQVSPDGFSSATSASPATLATTPSSTPPSVCAARPPSCSKAAGSRPD